METEPRLIGVINVESHDVKFSVLTVAGGNVLLESAKPIELIEPESGRVEVDAEGIWDALCAAIDEVTEELRCTNRSGDDIQAIGIINERGTAVVWDSESRQPIYNAIHYTDTRTDSNIEDYKSKNPNAFDGTEDETGLRVMSTFSGPKFKWIVDNADNVEQLTRTGTIRFGTLDTWLAWKLTGGKLYVTDVTNASRTLLMNIETLEWSPEACQVFNVPIALLPTIRSSSEHYGTIVETGLKDIPIGSILANHQAALYGLQFIIPGQTLSRYGDDCTVFCTTGTEHIRSNNGLISTVAYKIDNEPAVYALEGSAPVGGKLIVWLKNYTKILKSYEEIGTLDVEVSDVYMVPAINVLAAPHWKPEDRVTICGLTRDSNEKHIIRAALESLCFHTKDVSVAFEADTGIAPFLLMADGMYSLYDTLLNYQADILGVDVKRCRMIDMAVYGSAKAAARVKNIKFEPKEWFAHMARPTTTEQQRKYRYSKWLEAVSRSNEMSSSPPQVNRKCNVFRTKFFAIACLIVMMGIMVLSDKHKM